MVGDGPNFQFFSCKNELNWKTVCLLVVARSKHFIGVESESDSFTLK